MIWKMCILCLLGYSNLLYSSLAIGDDAPVFTLKDQEGFVHNLTSNYGKCVLLFFYPKDFSFSSKNIISKMSEVERLSNNDKLIIYGVSSDSIDNHRKFYDQMKISFDLLSDIKGEVIDAYGVQGLRVLSPRFLSSVLITEFFVYMMMFITF